MLMVLMILSDGNVIVNDSGDVMVIMIAMVPAVAVTVTATSTTVV